MNKKHVISILSCCILSLSIFSGCGNSNSAPKTNNASNAGGSAQTTAPITLRLSDNQPDDYVTVRADKKFAQDVETKTNGRIKVQVYSGGQLGDEKSVIEQVQFGAIDAVRIGVGPLAEFNKTIGALALPYLYTDKDQMFRVLDGPIGDKIFKDLSDNSKMVGLCWLDSGARNFYNTKKDIKTPDDLKGLKIRVQESKIMMDLIKDLGASPTPMAYGEVYSGLQTGVIDGAENNWPSYLSANHYEVAKHITIDEHNRLPEMIAISKSTWAKVSQADQKVMSDCAKDAATYERAEWLKDEQAAMNAVIAKGAIVTKLTDNKAFQTKVKPMYDEHPEWKDLINQIINTK